MTTDERLAFFRELLSGVSPNLTLVELDGNFDLIRTNAVDHSAWTNYFNYSYSPSEILKPEMLEDLSADLPGPMVCTNALGMTWLTEYTLSDGKINRVIVLGPVFLDDITPKDIEMKLIRRSISYKLIEPFMLSVKRMPVISLRRLYEYGIMMHRCVTGRNCSVSDFAFSQIRRSNTEHPEIQREYRGNYGAETEILRIVEEGNIRYTQNDLDPLRFAGGFDSALGGKTEYLRGAKNTVIAFIALCSRAAIRGGLSPDNAYYMRDLYTLQTEEARNLAAVTEINHQMFDDFVRAVHRAKTQQMNGISPQIADTCTFIVMHITDRLEIHKLAERFGYSDYYFSSKFKKEIGQTVGEYIADRKTEKVKQLLDDPSLKIGDIAAMLGYESQSHLGRIFLKRVGMTPSEWRTRTGETS
jgi:AraC-like DNA-binding protein